MKMSFYKNTYVKYFLGEKNDDPSFVPSINLSPVHSRVTNDQSRIFNNSLSRNQPGVIAPNFNDLVVERAQSRTQPGGKRIRKRHKCPFCPAKSTKSEEASKKSSC